MDRVDGTRCGGCWRPVVVLFGCWTRLGLKLAEDNAAVDGGAK